MIIVTLYTCLTTATEIISFPKFTISKLLKGRSEPRVGKVFGPNIPKVVRDPVLVTFLDRTSKHLKGRSGPRVGNLFGPNIPEVIRDTFLDTFLDRTSVRSLGTLRWTPFWTKQKKI